MRARQPKSSSTLPPVSAFSFWQLASHTRTLLGLP
jgi:hypothetical protein